MLKSIKYFFYIFSVLAISQNAHAFDLKALTDKIQKDVGGKLNIPQTNSGSNPLGGMLKGLNQNKGSTMMNTTGQSLSGTSSNTKLAKQMCEPTVPQTIKNLPKGNVALVEKDFGKSRNEIIKILNSIPSSSNDPYVSSLKTFEGAFETKEIEVLFNSFLKKKSIDDLATIRAIADMKPGFNNNKKQIKADALFAYGLVHYYLRDIGGKKNLGIQYISQAIKGPDNIGALTVYGAWQFYGLNVKQNIQAGNMSALTGYQRADDKKRKLNTDGPFKGLNAFKWAETVFFEIAGDDRNPYKQQYQSQLADARRLNKQVMAELEKSKKNSPKSGWWPFIIEQQNLQHDILDALGENIGLGQQLTELKSQYAVLASKVSNDNQLVERMVDINQAMSDKILKALNNAKSLDQEGKIQLANLSHDNEILLQRNFALTLELARGMMASGGFGRSFYEVVKLIGIAGKNEKVSCDVYSGVKSYASRTKVPLLKPVTSENAKFKSKFRRKRKS